MDKLRNELANYIPWIMAFHIIAVIAWMAGMLYLPRLFVYHAETAPGSRSPARRFKVMERRLLKGIINPAMIAVWILGPLLAWLTGAYLDTWLQIKFVLVMIMSGMHGLLCPAGGATSPTTATRARPASTRSLTKCRRC